MHTVSQSDLSILRDLARVQMEIAKSPETDILKREWYEHGDLKGKRPMITVELGTFADDILPAMLDCEGAEARELEKTLRSNIITHTVFGDDTVVRDHFPIGRFYYFRPFGLDVKVERSPDTLGHHFVPQIEDFKDDFHKLGASTFGNDDEAMKSCKSYIDELIGDILPTKLVGRSLYSVPTQDMVHVMSMETMYFAMYDYPDLFHKAMESLSDDYLALFDFLSENGLMDETTGDQWLGNGTFCFTNELPKTKEGTFTSNDIWGFCDSQETAGISADMYKEFIWPYYKKIADRYGLLSYGCCEAVDPIWDTCLGTQENLRKVSISAWCNENFMGERLRGSCTIYHRKPSPNFLGLGGELDCEAVRKHIRTTLYAAKGCKIEFTQRDVYQVGKSPEKVKKYVDIIRQECEDNYKY